MAASPLCVCVCARAARSSTCGSPRVRAHAQRIDVFKQVALWILRGSPFLADLGLSGVGSNGVPSSHSQWSHFVYSD
eukprot:3999326-Amphidinium_carterae.1